MCFCFYWRSLDVQSTIRIENILFFRYCALSRILRDYVNLRRITSNYRPIYALSAYFVSIATFQCPDGAAHPRAVYIYTSDSAHATWQWTYCLGQVHKAGSTVVIKLNDCARRYQRLRSYSARGSVKVLSYQPTTCTATQSKTIATKWPQVPNELLAYRS